MELDPVDVMVEIPSGSRNKYEYDPLLRQFRLDRVLFASVHYPADYGYVVGTLAADGDALDALVIVQEPTFPGCVIPARPIGVLTMRDEKGRDDKLLSVPLGDPRFGDIFDISDLASPWLAEIEYFFATYKTLERKATEVTGWQGVEAADQLIVQSRLRFTSREVGSTP